ncbi:MAG: winged helix-turn-helix domain-containing protein [Nitrososphaerales archaeon]
MAAIPIRNRMQNRQKDELLRDVVSSANGGAGISQIMFRAFITHGQAKGFLAELTRMDMVQYDAPERVYRTTQKGLKYLHHFNQISDMLQIQTRRAGSISDGLTHQTNFV